MKTNKRTTKPMSMTLALRNFDPSEMEHVLPSLTIAKLRDTRTTLKRVESCFQHDAGAISDKITRMNRARNTSHAVRAAVCNLNDDNDRFEDDILNVLSALDVVIDIMPRVLATARRIVRRRIKLAKVSGVHITQKCQK